MITRWQFYQPQLAYIRYREQYFIVLNVELTFISKINADNLLFLYATCDKLYNETWDNNKDGPNCDSCWVRIDGSRELLKEECPLTFRTSFSRSKCPSVRCASTANEIVTGLMITWSIISLLTYIFCLNPSVGYNRILLQSSLFRSGMLYYVSVVHILFWCIFIVFIVFPWADFVNIPCSCWVSALYFNVLTQLNCIVIIMCFHLRMYNALLVRLKH